MMKLFTSALFIAVLIPFSGFAKTASHLGNVIYPKTNAHVIFKNNCTYPINFIISKNQLFDFSRSIPLQPSQTTSDGYYAKTSQEFSFMHNGKKEGALFFKLRSEPLQTREDVSNISGSIAIDTEHIKWFPWHVTPSFTVTSCPDTVDVKNSPLLTDIQNIILFGDSLTDKGKLYKYSAGTIPISPPYYNGMFSNGNVWSVLLENELKGKIGVSNYAVGGATAKFHPRINKYLPYTLADEYAAYKIHAVTRKWKNNNHHLVFICIGANDYETAKQNLSEKKMQKLTTEVVGNIKWLTNLLIKQGMKKFVFIGIPSLSVTPESRQSLKNQKAAGRLTLLHDQKLEALKNTYVKEKGTRSGYSFNFIDLRAPMNNLTKNIGEYNKKYHLTITNITDPCWSGGYTNLTQKHAYKHILRHPFKAYGNVCSDPEHHLFWDKIHPTAQIHGVLYKIIKQTLNIKTLPFVAP